MEDRLNDAEQIVKNMEKETDLSKVDELIKDNKITFTYKDNKYRVRLLNLEEKEELDMLRRKKFGQLIKDKDILLEKDLILQYKERGINIDELDEQMKKNNAQDIDFQIKLGEAISKNEGETILKNYKEQIEDLRKKNRVINAQKNLLLEFSLENSILNYVAQVITYLSLEEFKDGIWKRMFKTLEEFQKYSDEKLINKSASYSMLLQYL
jgi:hypothetical protein